MYWPEEKTNADEGTKATRSQDMAYLTMSGELAKLAATTRDPILMLAAARLEDLAPTEEVSRVKTSKGGATEDGEDSEPEKTDLYELAKQFSGTNETLRTIIETTKSSGGTKQSTGGPRRWRDRVRANGTDSYVISFRGARTAEVAVLGDGDTDLDLFIYDEYDNLVCRDTDTTDQTYCSWSPAWTGSFRIKIENLGNVFNRYELLTN